jgi:glycosyltransferase involved in cell wall biosynthesis
VPLYLSASDFFVLPSKLEGMSNAILEAMAAGLPVVANRVGGNVELVRHNKTGFLCMQGDSSTLANAILKLIRDAELRKQQSKAARDLAMSEFSMEAMLRRYGDFYRRVSR